MYTKTNFGILPRTVNGLMGDIFFNGFNRLADEAPYQVPVNIRETDGSYDLHVVAPGLKKEDFKICVDKNILTISFEHQEQNKEAASDGKWLRSEYSTRSFKRNFTLNEKVDTASISAKYTDGILLITLPKKEVSTPATHEIAVN